MIRMQLRLHLEKLFFVILVFVLSSESFAMSFESSGVRFTISDSIEVSKINKSGELVSIEPERQNSKTLFSWTPKGYNENYTERYCSSENLRALFRRAKGDTRKQANTVQRWFNDCNDQVGKGNRTGFGPLVDAATLYYPMHMNREIRSVAIELPSGNIIRGFIALKPGSKPRPIIIGKCGIYCNPVQSRGHFGFFMHLFDESPFHVLTLANVTSTQFEFENSAVALGGFHGGRQFYEIAKALKNSNSNLARKISSVHVMGYSLGGHSALYSSLYSSMNLLADGTSAIDSVLAICPVVNLRNSMERMFSQDTIGNLFSGWTKKNIKKIVSRIPIMGAIFNEKTKENSEVLDQISRGSTAYYSMWTDYEPWPLAPFTGLTMDENVDKFYQVNNFIKYYRNIQIPTTILSSTNDRIIRYSDNTLPLRVEQKKNDNKHVNSIVMGQGDHCAYAEASGWRNMSILLREYFLSHSPEFQKSYKVKSVRVKEAFKNLNWFSRYRIHKDELVMGYKFRSYVNDEHLRVQIRIYNPYGGNNRDDGEECWRYKPHLANKNSCFRRVSAKVPLSKFGFKTPKNKYESNQITRFANTNFDVYTSGGKNIKYTKGFPKKVVFRDYR